LLSVYLVYFGVLEFSIFSLYVIYILFLFRMDIIWTIAFYHMFIRLGVLSWSEQVFAETNVSMLLFEVSTMVREVLMVLLSCSN
jgi:hypothetical protein